MKPEWVPFSERYGLRNHVLGEFHIASRHGERDYKFGNCEADERLRCACPGSTRRRCCERATQEDRLCDPCRDHCWGLDDAKNYRRLIDVFEAVAS